MPGNEVGDRVHNFFAPDNLFQGQHHSQVADGSWPVLGNNLWAGTQQNIGQLSSNSKNYHLQSDTDIGRGTHLLQVPHGMNFSQSTLRPDFSKTQSQSLQPNLNGYYVQGRQAAQAMQNEANFLGVDSESDHHGTMLRGSSLHESQQSNGPEHHRNISVRSETSDSPVSFDFFGGQQQMSGQQPGMLQPLSRQQSGFSDTQQVQQEVLFRKMQEFQRQQQLQQLEAMQQNSINQVSGIAKQGSGNHMSALMNNGSSGEASSYPWATELTANSTNWVQRGHPAGEGSSNGLVFSSDQGQAMHFTGMVPQQVDQSLYGVPISSTRGSQKQYTHIPMDKSPMQQVPTGSNAFPVNQYAGVADQVSRQDGPSVSRQEVPGKYMFGHASVRDHNSGISLENLHQMNALHRNASMQEFHGRQELDGSSETLQKEPMVEAAPSQNSVALDPTEEKILFGTDDNIWDAFGGSINMGAGGCNPTEGTGLVNGFPSVQSGSWSALMQSAVAETSSHEMGPQEEWSGLSSQNNELPIGNRHPSVYSDNRKQQAVFGDNYPEIVSTLNSGSVPFPDYANGNNNLGAVPGYQQSGHKMPYEHGEKMQTGLSQRSTQHSSEEGSRWLNRGPFQKPSAEGSQNFVNAAHSLDAEMNAKTMSSPGSRQQSMLSYNTHYQPRYQSALSSGDAASTIHEKSNSLKYMQSNDQKGAMYEEIGRVGGGKAGSVLNSGVELGPLKSSLGNARLNRQDSGLNNVGVIPNSSTRENMSQRPQNSQYPHWKPVDSSLKFTDSEAPGKPQHHPNSGPQVFESTAISFHKDTVKMHEMESCDTKENSSDSHRSHSLHDTSTGGLKENVSSDASGSRTLPWGKQKIAGPAGRKTSGPRKFQYHPMGNLDDNEEPSYGSKHATHPQGMSPKMSQGASSQSQGYFGQSKFFGQAPNNSSEEEKRHVPALQGSTNRSDEAPLQRILPGYRPSISPSVDRSISVSTENKAPQLSQNMLELLHKVDQSREHAGMHFRPLECHPLSDMPEADHSDGSVSHLPQSQSSASQGFCLQLAPPSQRLPVPDRGLSSQSSVPMVNSLNSNLTAPEIRERGHALDSTPKFQSLPPSHETFHREFRSGKITQRTGNEASESNMQRNFSSAFSSDFPGPESRLQNQPLTSRLGQVATNQSDGISLDRLTPYPKHAEDYFNQVPVSQSKPAFLPDTTGSAPHNNIASAEASQPHIPDHSREGVFAPKISVGEGVPASQSVTTSGAYSEMLPYAWGTNPGQECVPSVSNQKVPLNLFQSHHSNNSVESTVYTTQNVKDKGSEANTPSEFDTGSVKSQGMVHEEEKVVEGTLGQQGSSGNIDLAEEMNVSRGNESNTKHFSDATHSNPPSTQKDFEAFGRSLKPINFLHQNYSLLHQMRVMKSSGSDPSARELKRLKGADGVVEGQQVAPMSRELNDQNTMGEDALVRRPAAPSGDSKMLSFSGSVSSRERPSSSQLSNVNSKDLLAFGPNNSHSYSQSGNTSSGLAEHSRVSPQMAPSWFNQFGTFKNGQMFPMYGAQRAFSVKSLEQPFTLGKSFDGLQKQHHPSEQVYATADTSQVGDARQCSTLSSVATEHVSSTLLLPADVTDQHLDVLRPKKRKIATSELLPWHKEVVQGSQSLLVISKSEVDWARAANRLIDKVGDEADIIEDGPPLLRSKRRIILTTQLVQQLLRPPPAAVLSSDAYSNYENVAYLVARVALGDACSITSCAKSNLHGSLDSVNIVPNKHETSVKIDDQHLSRVAEDFIDRARKLESDFLRLDKRASLLDLRVESQELEKFSVINRFAKFHGRGQAEGTEASSSDAAVNSQKLCPQRYVTALPVPRNLPDRVQCLSL